MKLNFSITVISCLIIAASHQTFAAQSAPDNAQLVSTEIVKHQQVNPTMWLPGNVISRMDAQISAEQTGQLLWVEDVGKQVEQGDIIATLDNRHLQFQLARQQALVKQHQANVDYLAKQKKRLLALNKTNNTSQSELERTTKDLTVAENEVIALGMQVKQTLLAIEKTQIKAPFSGNISERFVDVGELIAIGRPLVQLVDTKDLDIQIAAPLAIAQYLTVGRLVIVKWQNRLVELPIRAWSLAGNQSTRTFDVRLQAKELPLISGAAVTVSLPKKQVSDATMVPRDALVLREKETFVMTVDGEGKAKKVNVLVGQGIGRWVSVSGQVNSGDEVIVRGGERLQGGEAVRKNDALIARQLSN